MRTLIIFSFITFCFSVQAQRPVGDDKQNETPIKIFNRMYDAVDANLKKCESKKTFIREAGTGGRFHEFYNLLKNQYLKDGLKIETECAPGGEKMSKCLVKGIERELFDFVEHREVYDFLRKHVGGYKPDEMKEVLQTLKQVNPKYTKYYNEKIKTEDVSETDSAGKK